MDIQALHEQSNETEEVSPQHRDAATALSWAGRSLLGLFLILLIARAWPIQLLQPSWLQKVSQQLITSGTTAVIGTVLIVLAPLFDNSEDRLLSQATLIRRLSIWVAFGFALLIPLQGYTGMKLLGAEKTKQLQELNKAEKAVQAIQASSTRQELQNALARLPGNRTPRLPAELSVPFEQARDRIADALQPRIKRAETQLEEARSKRLQKWLEFWARNALGSLMYFLAFAAIGQQAPRRPTLISQLFNVRFRGFAPRAPKKDKRGGRRSSRKKTLDKQGVISTAWIDEDGSES